MRGSACGRPESSYRRVSGGTELVLVAWHVATEQSAVRISIARLIRLQKRRAASLHSSCNVVRRAHPADYDWNADAWPPDSGAAERVAGQPAGQTAGGGRTETRY